MTTDGFDYNFIDNKIHKFVIHSADRKTFDDHLQKIEEILIAIQDTDDPFLTIIDYSKSGLPPVNYSFTRSNRVIKTYGRKRVFRTLIIHNDSTVIQIVESLLKPFGFLSIRFIKPGETEQHLAWLTDTDK